MDHDSESSARTLKPSRTPRMSLRHATWNPRPPDGDLRLAASRHRFILAVDTRHPYDGRLRPRTVLVEIPKETLTGRGTDEAYPFTTRPVDGRSRPDGRCAALCAAHCSKFYIRKTTH